MAIITSLMASLAACSLIFISFAADLIKMPRQTTASRFAMLCQFCYDKQATRQIDVSLAKAAQAALILQNQVKFWQITQKQLHFFVQCCTLKKNKLPFLATG